MKFISIFISIILIFNKVYADVTNTTNYEYEFNSFVRKYNKFYTNKLEMNKRYSIWKSNYDFVVKHNMEADAKMHTYRLKINKFADLAPKEFSALAKGYTSSLRKLYKTINNVDNNISFGLKRLNSIDWKKLKRVTNVKNQGICGSCWAFAAVALIEYVYAKQTGNLVQFSEQQLVDCSSNKNYNNEGCNGGWPSAALDYVLDNNGISLSREYPYIGQEKNCSKANFTIGRIKGYNSIPSGKENILQDVLSFIGPVAVGIDSSNPSFQFYDKGIYYEPKCSRINLDHAVTVVGYSTINNKEYYIVKNSWGPDWGEKGYIRMSRNRGNNCGIATDAVYAF